MAESALVPFDKRLSAFNELFNAVLQLGEGNSNEQPKTAQGNIALQQIIKPLGEAILNTEQPALV
jgi:hypothetical protein